MNQDWPLPHRDLGGVLRMLGRLPRFTPVRDPLRYIIVPMVLWPGLIAYAGPRNSLMIQMPDGGSYVDGVMISRNVVKYCRRGDRVWKVFRITGQKKYAHLRDADHMYTVYAYWEFLANPRAHSGYNCTRPEGDFPGNSFVCSYPPLLMDIRRGVITVRHVSGEYRLPRHFTIEGDLFLRQFVDHRSRLVPGGHLILNEFTLWDGCRRAWVAIGIECGEPEFRSQDESEMRAIHIQELMPRHSGGPVASYLFDYPVVAAWRAGTRRIVGVTAWGERIRARRQV